MKMKMSRSKVEEDDENFINDQSRRQQDENLLSRGITALESQHSECGRRNNNVARFLMPTIHKGISTELP